jgi:deaminated glutathione amidase
MRIACIQLTSIDHEAENIAAVSHMVMEAAGKGAQFIATPENVFLMASGEKFHAQVHSEEGSPALAEMQQLAKQHGIYLLIGSMHIKPKTGYAPDGRYVNRSLLLGPDGQIVMRYDKIHLFDVELPNGETHKESERFHGGDTITAYKTPLASFGLTICYDVRFPYLYSNLALSGAQIITVPAAFTYHTGNLGHWHILLRARAIETNTFIVAPAQCGHHKNGRHTYGHSLIIAPDGKILAEAGDEPALLYADIDLEEITRTRKMLPNLEHRRSFKVESCQV